MVRRKEKACKILYNLLKRKMLQRLLDSMNQWFYYLNNTEEKPLTDNEANNGEWLVHYIKISNTEVEWYELFI